MKKIHFIFIALTFILLPFEEIENELVSTIEVIFCSVLIATFGIAHGAIDNYLYGFKDQKSNIKFIIVYVLIGSLFGILWTISPAIAAMTFIVISAYHFGQSQFVDYSFTINWYDRSLYLVWGVWLLSAFVFYNSDPLLAYYDKADLSLPVFGTYANYSGQIMIITSVLLAVLFLYFIYKKELNWQEVLIEVYQLALISIVFYFSSPLLGFTLYFVILHSIRVLQHEYDFVKAKNTNTNLLSFVKLLSPFTLISLAGLAIFISIIGLYSINLSLPIISLIFVSCLTFPHAIVLEVFYIRLKSS